MAVATASDQRERILAAALRLMAGGGAHAMSMRSLAAACDLNVATLYHYFPSKAELLREVVAAQSYEELLAQQPPVPGPTAAPAERLAALLRWIWTEMATQDDMWRLLLGESLRGERVVLEVAAELSATFEQALERWLGDLFAPGELPAPAPQTARVLRGLVYGFFVENLPLPAPDRVRYLSARADEVAALLTSPGA